MDSIRGTISSITGAASTQVDESSIDKGQEPTTSTMETIKGTINSITGAGSSQTDDNDNNTTLKPTPPETGLQSREQTEQSGSGSFLGELKDMVNSAVGRARTKEEKELALDKGQRNDESAVEQAGDEQIEEFIRDKYHSQADGDVKAKDN